MTEEMRVVVNGTTHRLRATLAGNESGQECEVQIAKIDGGLVVIIAGDVILDWDEGGHVRAVVAPSSRATRLERLSLAESEPATARRR